MTARSQRFLANMGSATDEVGGLSSATHHDPAPEIQQEDRDQEQIYHVKAMDQIIHNAKTATEKEKNMTLLQGIRLYPKAIGWSVLISTCIVMEGFDVALINNFCKTPFPSSPGQAPERPWALHEQPAGSMY